MDWKGIYLRIGGGVLTLIGIILILISGELVSTTGIDMPGRTAEFMLRSGFGAFLVGILMLFLFSFRTIPLELSSSLQRTQGRNLGRLMDALNLEGNGIYIPSGGRLLEDRVYVPLEKNLLPLPEMAKETVFNVGTTGPSMGIALIPPGLDLVDQVEKDGGRPFRDDQPSEMEEALDRLGKGTGTYSDISSRINGSRIELTIKHSRFKKACDVLWEEHPDLHFRTGCPGCSAAICASSRILKSPLRIISARKEKGSVIYELERM